MIKDPSKQHRLVECFPFLHHSEPELREALFNQAKWITLPTGHVICHDGDHCAHLALVIAGRARIYKLGENGREVTLYRVEPGESCVVTASCILSRRPFPAFAVCETPLEAIVVSKAHVQQWLMMSAHWRDFIFTLVADRLGEVFAVLDAVLFQPLDQRLAALLLHRFEWSRAETSSDRILHVTHQELAAELGSSREVITRLLRDFETAGALVTGRGRIQLRDGRILETKSRPT